MQYVLSTSARSILTGLAHQQTLYAFDFDGTLSPIVASPFAAGLRERTRTLLALLAQHYPVIVISGRARADVLGKLDGVEFAGVIGNHGAETGQSEASQPRVPDWKTSLLSSLHDVPGVWIEDKGLSLAVHYRQSPQKLNARRQILAVARNLKGARVFGGKYVVNVVPQNASSKGDALAAERTRLGCSWVLYVGDDENDEDAFALEGNTVSVRIGWKKHTGAQYYLRSQTEIDDLLELLLQEVNNDRNLEFGNNHEA